MRIAVAFARLLAASALLAILVVVGDSAGPAAADSFVPVSGAGSTWSANALDQWIADVQQYGMQINYAPTGSSDGRQEYLQGTVDFAASDIPFQSHPLDGSAAEVPAAGSYAYMPITAGGTVFMYNLVINGQRVTNLRLSGQNIAKIFSGEISNWSDPALAADNPQLSLPSRAIVPVVRSDGSGSTAQFSLWMLAKFPDSWNDLCHKSGRAPACGATSYYPTTSGMIAQSGDLGVAGYVAQNYAQGAIGYVNYSYALNAHFPVAKMLNAAGYYTEPTPNNVAVSLLQAQVDTTDVNDPSLYLTQKLGGVYDDTDPRTYPLSSYSYLILPTKIQGQFSTAKGKTLAAFSYYAMCQGQQESASLGYSPMPYNLVEASFTQITKIPGAVVENINIQSCNNPTFSTTSPNLLANTAPMPPACDKTGAVQCATGTGGAQGATALTGGSTSSSGATGTSGGGTSTGGTSSGAAARGAGSSTAKTGGATSAPGSRVAATGKGKAAVGSSAPRSGAGSSAAGGGATALAAGAPSGAASACDPSSGSCGSTAGDVSSGAAAPAGGGATQALASTVTLPPRNAWSAMAATLLVVLLVVGLVLAPGATALLLRRRQ